MNSHVENALWSASDTPLGGGSGRRVSGDRRRERAGRRRRWGMGRVRGGRGRHPLFAAPRDSCRQRRGPGGGLALERARPGHAPAVRPDADQSHRGQWRPLYDHRQPAQRDCPRCRYRRAHLELAPGRQRTPVGRHHRAGGAERRARRVLLDGRDGGRAHLRGDAELPTRGPRRPDGESRAGLWRRRRDRHDGRPALERAAGRGAGGPRGQYVTAGDSRQRARGVDLAAYRQHSHPRVSQRGLAHEHAGRRGGLRHPHRPHAMALQHCPWGRRVRGRDLAAGGRGALGCTHGHARLGAGASGSPGRFVEVHG